MRPTHLARAQRRRRLRPLVPVRETEPAPTAWRAVAVILIAFAAALASALWGAG